VRRLVYREAWRRDLNGIRRVVALAQGRLVLEDGEGLAGLDAANGQELWRARALPGAIWRGSDLFHAEPGDALVRIDAISGEVRWKRRLRGARPAGRLWALPAGVVRSLPGEGLAQVADSGELAFRTKLPGGAPEHVALASGVLLAATSSGLLVGLGEDGSLLWKRGARTASILACGSRALVLSTGALQSIDPASGKAIWEREVPEDAGELVVHEGAAVLLGAGEVLAFSAVDGAPRPRISVPWAEQLVADEDGPLIAAANGGAAMRLDGRKRWSVSPAGDSAAPAQVHRGIVLLQRTRTELYDAGEGLLVAELEAAQTAALGPDLSCALLQDGAVSLHRLATHLSLV
jgi:outer membrane protein assembly factor BamB